MKDREWFIGRARSHVTSARCYNRRAVRIGDLAPMTVGLLRKARDGEMKLARLCVQRARGVA